MAGRSERERDRSKNMFLFLSFTDFRKVLCVLQVRGVDGGGQPVGGEVLPLVDEVVLEVGALVDPVAVVKLRPEKVIASKSELSSREGDL